jgi:hypothetical protein
VVHEDVAVCITGSLDCFPCISLCLWDLDSIFSFRITKGIRSIEQPITRIGHQALDFGYFPACQTNLYSDHVGVRSVRYDDLCIRGARDSVEEMVAAVDLQWVGEDARCNGRFLVVLVVLNRL